MKQNINAKLITSVAMLLALVSAPAFGGLVCTNPTSPCISISAVLSPVLKFTGSGPPGNTLEVSTTDPINGFQGAATYNASNGSSDTGVAVFGAMDFTTTGPLTTPPPSPPAPIPPTSTSPYFPASGPVPPETFVYQASTDSDLLDMNITWTSVIPNAPMGEPQLFGIGTITKLQGDAIFTMDFGKVGDPLSIGANFPLSGNCDLTRLATGSCMAKFELAALEGGDATPGIITTTGQIVTPEPMSSFMVLGVALFCLWGTRQMMRRRRYRSWS